MKDAQRKAMFAKLALMKHYPYSYKHGNWEISDGAQKRLDTQVKQLKASYIKPEVRDWQYAGDDQPASVIIVKNPPLRIISLLKKRGFYEADISQLKEDPS